MTIIASLMSRNITKFQDSGESTKVGHDIFIVGKSFSFKFSKRYNGMIRKSFFEGAINKY